MDKRKKKKKEDYNKNIKMQMFNINNKTWS